MAKTQRPDQLLLRVAFLKEVPLFAPLDEGVLAYLANEFRTRQYRKGEILFHQGDESCSLYVLVQGKVRVYHSSPNGDETTVNLLTCHGVLGEFALIDGQPRSASAQAITACTLLEMAGDRCRHHLETIPGLAYAMCKQVVNKTRWTSMYAEAINRLDAAGRLLHFLLLYKDKLGEEIEAGKQYVVDLGLNQSDLATLVGARRNWVNHILQEWRRRGLVEFDAGRLTILDLPRVQAELAGRDLGQLEEL